MRKITILLILILAGFTVVCAEGNTPSASLYFTAQAGNTAGTGVGLEFLLGPLGISTEYSVLDNSGYYYGDYEDASLGDGWEDEILYETGDMLSLKLRLYSKLHKKTTLYAGTGIGATTYDLTEYNVTKPVYTQAFIGANTRVGLKQKGRISLETGLQQYRPFDEMTAASFADPTNYQFYLQLMAGWIW